jgi:hypothetical protein
MNPTILFMDRTNLERKILDKILYVVGKSNIPAQLLVAFITLFINMHRKGFLPPLWQLFLILDNNNIKFVDHRT